MSLQNQNDVGTILFARHDNKDVLFPYTQIGDKFRGGMFWCIPNQGKGTPPFTAQNGEYRKEEGIDKKLNGPWGDISVSIHWEMNERNIATKAIISAEKDSYLRPGLHPYFAVGSDFAITIGERHLSKDDIAHDEPVYIECKNGEATLETEYKTIRISVNVDKDIIAYFCIWTDNKDRYVCIEPVLGGGIIDGTLTPFVLQEKDSVSISSTITY